MSLPDDVYRRARNKAAERGTSESALGCTTVLSEDLTAGRDYGGVRIENPFEEYR